MSQNRNPKVVEEAKERDDFTCQKCGLQDPSTVEGHHIEPLSVGGIDAVENVSTLCDYCHDFAPMNIQPTDFEAVFQIYVSTGLTPDHDLLLFGSMLHSDMDSHQQVAESLHYLYDNSLTMPNASLDMRWIQASRKVDYRGIREYFPKGSKCGVHGMDTELSRQAILQRVDDPDCYHGEPPKGSPTPTTIGRSS
ncbi:HNH endonuclease [Haloarcula brevis]|uniref:HNH endonuclease n=1 Tax=Haloarcula brevis TaxID=3111453 RepID=UPI00300ECC16